MASLALRPANASEEAKNPADVHDSTNGDAPAPVDEDVAMDDDIDESLLRDQLRQQQDERAQRLQAKNRRKRYL